MPAKIGPVLAAANVAEFLLHAWIIVSDALAMFWSVLPVVAADIDIGAGAVGNVTVEIDDSTAIYDNRLAESIVDRAVERERAGGGVNRERHPAQADDWGIDDVLIRLIY